MPNFVFQGPSPGSYPMLRDASGALAGTVEPGDVLEFGQAPGADWAPCDDKGKTAARALPAAAQQPQPGDHDDKAGVTGSEED